LSDRDGVEFTFDRFIEDFEAVVAAASLDRFDLFGFSGGAMTGIAYAARFPHRVDRLIIGSSTAYGPLSTAASVEFRQTAATQLEAIELGWPNENPAFRQLFTSMMIPDGNADQFRLFNQHIRLTTPPANGKRIIEAIWNADVRIEAGKLRCATLVFHSRQDGRIPFEQGRELAGLIPGARFVPLESRNHLIFETEPAWKQVVEAVNEFLAVSPDRSTAVMFDELTSREREVLELVARGLTNTELSARLKISEKTVRNHVSIILSKLGAVSRAQVVAVARDAGFGRRTAP
jgi:pimeloyl-ACP methyl ester carboxylesterase/DNA-binding CsgD family transcriptional regulator